MLSDEYRKLAETEDRMWYFRALHRRLANGLAGALPGGPARVLDAGCGTGGFLRRLQATRPEWTLTGADLSPLACELARQRTAAPIVEASLAALPFADGAFDAAVCGDVLYHIEDVGQVLREIRRCLRPGGAFVANEPAYRWLWSYHDDAVESKHRFTRGELVELMTRAGFDVEFASYANLPVLPLVVLRRKLLPPSRPTSDVRLQSGPVEAVLAGLAAFEHSWLGRGWASPVGSSVFVVAKRR